MNWIFARFWLPFFIFGLYQCNAQVLSLRELLEQDTSYIVRKVIANQDKYKLQLIYSQVNRDSQNTPKLYTQYYRYKPNELFYLASLVKMPCAALALEKIRSLKIKGLERYTLFKPQSNYRCYGNIRYLRYEKAESMSQLIRRLFVLSDNNAYNLLFEFLGQEYIHTRFLQMGYDSARVIQKFTACTPTACRTTGPIKFYNNGKVFYTTPKTTYNKVLQNPLQNTVLGTRHIEGNHIKNYGLDCRFSNYISLGSMHNFLIAINLPSALPSHQRFKLAASDYEFLRTSMSMYPRELSATLYPYSKYPDSHMKYFLLGNSTEKLDSNIKIFNKVGMYYGYMSDCAYIVDNKRGLEFFVSAVLYCNENGIINGGKYEYEQIGYPFFKRVGEILLNYEAKRR
jgi:hypothetical protein